MFAVPFLNIPIISVVLLLLAGILIGHLIWYRDRSDDEATSSGLRAENSELQAALHEHKQAYVGLEADLEDRRKEWDQMKSTHKQLELAHQSTDQDLAELNNEIARLQQLKDQAFHDLDQERQQRRTLQEALGQAEENTNRVNSLSSQLQSQVVAFQSERDEIDQLMNARIAETESSLKQQLQAVTDERDELQSRLAQQQDAATDTESLATERDQAQREIESLQSKYDEAQQKQTTTQEELVGIQQSVESMRTQLLAREQAVESLREERDELAQQIDDERSSREKVESQVQNVEQLISQRDNAIAQTGVVEKEIAELRQELDQLREEGSQNEHSLRQIGELQDKNEQLQAKLGSMTQEQDAVTTMLVDERTRLSKMEADNHRLSLVVSESTQRSDLVNQEMKSRLEEQTLELSTLRTELEETAAQLSRERHQREHLQGVLHDHKAKEENTVRDREQLQLSMQSLTTQNQSLARESNELLALRGEHASVKRMLTIAHDELSELRDAHDVATTQHQEMELLVDRITKDYSHQVAQLESEKDGFATEFDRLQQAHSSTLSNRMELDTRIEQIEEENRALRQRVVEAAELKESHREQQERLDKIVAQRDEAMHTSAEHLEKVEAMRQQIESQSRKLSAVNQQNDQLRPLSDELNQLRGENLDLQTQMRESAERLGTLARECEERRQTDREASERIAFLEARSKVNEETIRNLRRERAAVVTRSRQPLVSSVPMTRSIPEESGGRMRRDEVLGMVYTQPPKRKDDLKRISGIAQVLEKKLNAFGVYTYRQIMEWDAVAIAEFSKLLSFRDRIERDDWIGQARGLQYEAYGRAA